MLREGQDAVLARIEANPVEITVYKDSLAAFRNKIASTNLLTEIKLIDQIDSLKDVANDKIDERVNTFYAVLSANPSNPGLLHVYNEVAKNRGVLTNRQITLDIAILTHLIDTTNATYEQSVKLEIDTLLTVTSALEKALVRVDSVLTVTTTPYVLVRVTDVITPDTIKYDSQFEVTVKYKNFGNTATSALDVLVDSSAKLSLDKDSISVPSLSAQEESSVKLKVTAGDIDKNPYLYVSFGKVNSMSETVILKLQSIIRTKGDVLTATENQNFEDKTVSVDIFPNPANNFINVKSNKTLSNAKLTIMDAQGITYYSQNYTSLNQGEIVTVPTDNFKDGIYIVNLEDGTGNSFKRNKIIIANLK